MSAFHDRLKLTAIPLILTAASAKPTPRADHHRTGEDLPDGTYRPLGVRTQLYNERDHRILDGITPLLPDYPGETCRQPAN